MYSSFDVKPKYVSLMKIWPDFRRGVYVLNVICFISKFVKLSNHWLFFSGLDGFYFPAPTLPLSGNFDLLFNQFNRFAFSSPENNDMSTYIPTKFYQASMFKK